MVVFSRRGRSRERNDAGVQARGRERVRAVAVMVEEGSDGWERGCLGQTGGGGGQMRRRAAAKGVEPGIKLASPNVWAVRAKGAVIESLPLCSHALNALMPATVRVAGHLRQSSQSLLLRARLRGRWEIKRPRPIILFRPLHVVCSVCFLGPILISRLPY